MATATLTSMDEISAKVGQQISSHIAIEDRLCKIEADIDRLEVQLQTMRTHMQGCLVISGLLAIAFIIMAVNVH